MRHIKKKIQSERGASITFALILFLICSVVGSIVLTAGSVASGRMSGLVESDQRYYNVISAARLIRDTFLSDAPEIIVTKTTMSQIESKTTLAKDGNDEKTKTDIKNSDVVFALKKEGQTGDLLDTNNGLSNIQLLILKAVLETGAIPDTNKVGLQNDTYTMEVKLSEKQSLWVEVTERVQVSSAPTGEASMGDQAGEAPATVTPAETANMADQVGEVHITVKSLKVDNENKLVLPGAGNDKYDQYALELVLLLSLSRKGAPNVATVPGGVTYTKDGYIQTSIRTEKEEYAVKCEAMRLGIPVG